MSMFWLYLIIYLIIVLQQQKKQRLNVLDHSRAATCCGGDSLLQTLNDMDNMKDDEKMLKVGVVGKLRFNLYGLVILCLETEKFWDLYLIIADKIIQIWFCSQWLCISW